MYKYSCMNTKREYSTTTKSTDNFDIGSNNYINLNNIEIDCGDNKVISGLKLLVNKDNDKFKYEYKC